MSEKYGEALSIARSEDEKQEIYEKYILGKPEPIESKLAVEPVLRAAVLSLVASGFARTEESLLDFFANSFWGYQYKDIFGLRRKLTSILKKLEQYGFIKIERWLLPTTLGRRISELYLDPESAHHIITGLKNAEIRTPAFAFLHLIAGTVEIGSPLRPRKSDFEEIQEKMLKYESSLLVPLPKEWDIAYELFVASFKTAMMLQDWADERSEEYVLEQYRIRPGELYGRLTNADWLLYSAQELARILSLKEIQTPIIKTRLRLKYGIREELLPLVKLKNIGRVRARRLYGAGLTSLATLKRAPVEKLVRLLGTKLAADVRRQLGLEVEETKKGQLKF